MQTHLALPTCCVPLLGRKVFGKDIITILTVRLWLEAGGRELVKAQCFLQWLKPVFGASTQGWS